MTDTINSGWNSIRRFYVDSVFGNDDNDGLTPKTAWRTQRAIDKHTKPGDKVFFPIRDRGLFKGPND